MARKQLTHEILESILIRVPEGLISRDILGTRVKIKSAQNILLGIAGQYNSMWFYDKSRLTADQVGELTQWCRPSFPQMTRDQIFLDPPIQERIVARQARLVNASWCGWIWHRATCSSISFIKKLVRSK